MWYFKRKIPYDNQIFMGDDIKKKKKKTKLVGTLYTKK